MPTTTTTGIASKPPPIDSPTTSGKINSSNDLYLSGNAAYKNSSGIRHCGFPPTSANSHQGLGFAFPMSKQYICTRGDDLSEESDSLSSSNRRLEEPKESKKSNKIAGPKSAAIQKGVICEPRKDIKKVRFSTETKLDDSGDTAPIKKNLPKEDSKPERSYRRLWAAISCFSLVGGIIGLVMFPFCVINMIWSGICDVLRAAVGCFRKAAE